MEMLYTQDGVVILRYIDGSLSTSICFLRVLLNVLVSQTVYGIYTYSRLHDVIGWLSFVVLFFDLIVWGWPSLCYEV